MHLACFYLVDPLLLGVLLVRPSLSATAKGQRHRLGRPRRLYNSTSHLVCIGRMRRSHLYVDSTHLYIQLKRFPTLAVMDVDDPVPVFGVGFSPAASPNIYCFAIFVRIEIPSAFEYPVVAFARVGFLN